MRVTIDARAAILYRGTGIGTYAFELIRHLPSLDRLNAYDILLPDESVVPLNLQTERLLNYAGVKKPGFWDSLNPPRLTGDQGDSAYLVPQNGIGLPSVAPGRHLLVTIHDLIPFILPQTCSRVLLRRATAELPQAVEAAESVLTVSYHSKRDLMEILGVPESKIVVTYEAPDDNFRPLDRSAARTAVASRLGIAVPFILNIGGFSYRKNIFGLIQAFADLAARTPIPHDLVIIGRPGGGSFEQCRAVAERLGVANRVRFPGFVAAEDLPVLYNAADLFVFPSFYEGFGLPPLEAMACGTPTIVSDTSSLPEVVGRGALLVNPYDPDALSRAMELVLLDHDYGRDLAARGRARAGGFSWQRTAQQTLLCLEQFAVG